MQLNVPATIQAAVDQAEWREFVAEHRVKAAHDGVCPKCSIGRLRFYQPTKEYQCDAECSYWRLASMTKMQRVQRASKAGYKRAISLSACRRRQIALKAARARWAR